ncbi:unnamed protein product [Coregonus sp. 'balchen']|nr:unnamed protein product [Coregonus sp. 'balchen']
MDLSDPEEQLLHYAKTGSLSLIQCLLQLRIEQDLRLNINCRVLLLLRYDASATIINGKAQIPKALSRKRPPDIDCRDLQGNTPLHCAAYRGQKQCVGKLLKCGASSSMKNKSDQTVFDLACSEEIKQILEGSHDKSSRFLGWRSHWVVIQDGVLSWYPRQADAVANVRKQGAKALMKAHCRVKAWDKCFFSLRCFDHSLHHFKVSSKTDPEAIRKRWLDALEEHTSYSSCYSTQEQTTEDEEGDEDTLGDLTDSLQAAEACQQKLETQVSIFLSMVKNEENNTLAAPLLLKARETSDLSRETSSALHSCLGLFSKQQKVQ